MLSLLFQSQCLLFTNLPHHLLSWLLFFFRLCLLLFRHRHPETLIYKHTVKTWPIPFLPYAPSSERQSGGGVLLWLGRKQKKKWLWLWFASQIEAETKSLNVNEQLVLICLPGPQPEGMLGNLAPQRLCRHGQTETKHLKGGLIKR